MKVFPYMLKLIHTTDEKTSQATHNDHKASTMKRTMKAEGELEEKNGSKISQTKTNDTFALATYGVIKICIYSHLHCFLNHQILPHLLPAYFVVVTVQCTVSRQQFSLAHFNLVRLHVCAACLYVLAFFKVKTIFRNIGMETNIQKMYTSHHKLW